MRHLRAGSVTNHVDGFVEIGLSEGVSAHIGQFGSRFYIVHQHFVELHHRCVGDAGVTASTGLVDEVGVGKTIAEVARDGPNVVDTG